MSFHIRPDNTYGECSAHIKDCPFDGAKHFETESEARAYSESLLSIQYEGGMVSTQKEKKPVAPQTIKMSPNTDVINLRKLEDKLALESVSGITSFANESRENYDKLARLVVLQKEESRDKFDRIKRLIESNDVSDNVIELLKREWWRERKESVTMITGLNKSRFSEVPRLMK